MNIKWLGKLRLYYLEEEGWSKKVWELGSEFDLFV